MADETFKERIKREMFDRDFYPTPDEVIEKMLEGLDLEGKTVLEPSAGKGNIAKVLKERGAHVIMCEDNKDLALIASQYGDMIASDFLTVQDVEISHIDYIIMNPPFSEDDKHILHAFEIMPDHCHLVALCNWKTIDNRYSSTRKELAEKIGVYGRSENLGQVFKAAERTTAADIGLVHLKKFGSATDDELLGYFSEEEDDFEGQENGLMSYNAVREVVQRYVTAVRLYDTVLGSAVEMNELIKHVGDITDERDDKKPIVFTCSAGDVAINRNMFMKQLQKKSWGWIFNKMNMDKYVTSDVMKDINKYIEDTKMLKFTMKNIYKMFEMVIGTSSQYMDKALVKVFDVLTTHTHENRWCVEGWKTNSDYLVNRKFIKPYACSRGFLDGKMEISWGDRRHVEMEDLQKALCYTEGQNYDKLISLGCRIDSYIYLKKNGEYVRNKEYKHTWEKFRTEAEADYFMMNNRDQGYTLEYPPKWGEWFDWGFFRVKLFKKLTGHFEFKSEDTWMRFNQNIARIKGFPLPEKTAQPKQKRTRKTKED